MEVAQTPLQLTQDHQDGRMTGKKLPFLKKKMYYCWWLFLNIC